MHSLPYWRLSGFYFFHFAVIGAFVPYWSLYLQSLGLSPARIGELVAIGLVTKLVAPNLWGWLADRLGRPVDLVTREGLDPAIRDAVLADAEPVF